MDERQPWARIPGESKNAYDAFQHYYLLPAGERSIDAAWRTWYARTKQQQPRDGRRAPGHWGRWASEHNWVLRAAAYDEHLAEQDRLLWEARRQELKRRDWEQADALRNLVADALPHAQQFIRRRTTTVDGQPVVIVEFDITALTRVLIEASKLQRLSVDEPTDNIHLSGAALDAAIERELERRLAELADSDEAGHAGPTPPDGRGRE